MNRLTKRHVYDKNNHVSLGRKKNGLTCSNFCTNCGKADCDNIREALFKLAKYEDLEEQGKLLKLPCAVGDTVYTLNALPKGKMAIVEVTADAFICALCMFEGRFGKTIFMTVEEAEAESKRIEGNE